MADEQMTLDEALQQVLESLDSAIPATEFYQKVLTLRPSQAKNPTASIREKLRFAWADRLLRANRDTVIPARLVMEGVRIAVPLDRQEINKGLLFAYPALDGFVSHNVPLTEIKLSDAQGRPLPVQLRSFTRKIKTRFGDAEEQYAGFELDNWFKRHQARRGDYVLITIEDWARKHLRLEYEPAKMRERRKQEIEAKNRELADLLFNLLESDSGEGIIASTALLVAYAQMRDPHGYPGDHWRLVVAEDPRMRYDGWMIHYSDWQSPLDAILGNALAETQPSPQAQIVLSPEQERSVYRFKAALKHRTGLWRRIDIQGGQTLADFNQVLVNAFGHDWDHMGGFWKRVQRGQSKRYREIDLGSIDPFGEGTGADVTIASTEMQPGDTLKYVFDFGDWIEHTLTLEDILEPEAGVTYPCIVAQNRVRHHYCETCKAAGRKTIATWICIECSDRETREVFLCEDCLTEQHENHYADEILY